MSPSTITLLFLAFAIVSFILEKIPLGLTATIVAIGLNLTGVLSNSDTFRLCQQQRHPVRGHVRRGPGSV